MNGAECLLESLVASGVEVCFANPGTSEMHFVSALDQVPELRGVLALFEGVATGAADGYGRVRGRPAAVLLHLGPGLGNGLANLHNARRAHTPVVVIVGDHATFHRRFDAPLTSDIESVARTVSSWWRTALRTDDVGADAAAAVAASLEAPGGVATLILPADVSWSDSSVGPALPLAVPEPALAPASAVDGAVVALRSGESTALLLGGRAVRRRGLVAAARIAVASGSRLLCETFPANLERGAGLPAVERLGYLAEFIEAQLGGVRHLILAGADAPVPFFAYPGRPSWLVPDGCQVHLLAGPVHDAPASLEAVAEALAAPDDGYAVAQASRPVPPSGPLNAETAAAAIGALLPEDAVVVDEANTSGLFVPGATAGCPHDWLTLTGGAIGQGMPVAVGAAIAAPGRRVVNLEADGSAMYTLQALWTQAHERLDVTTVVFANRSYAILNLELARVGAEGTGPRAAGMLALTDPPLDFVALATGMGVPATRATTADELVDQLGRSFAQPGPSLIEAVVPAL